VEDPGIHDEPPHMAVGLRLKVLGSDLAWISGCVLGAGFSGKRPCHLGVWDAPGDASVPVVEV